MALKIILVRFDSAFAGADCDRYKFPHYNKIENPPISFAYIERPQYQDVWNYSDYVKFSGPRSSDAFRCAKNVMPKNANFVKGERARD